MRVHTGSQAQKTARSAEALASALVDVVMPPPSASPTLLDVLSPDERDALEFERQIEALWERLLARLRSDLPAHIRKHWMTHEQELAVTTTLRQALPEPLQHDLWRLNESHDIEREFEREGAYRVGLEMGRRQASNRSVA